MSGSFPLRACSRRSSSRVEPREGKHPTPFWAPKSEGPRSLLRLRVGFSSVTFY